MLSSGVKSSTLDANIFFIEASTIPFSHECVSKWGPSFSASDAFVAGCIASPLISLLQQIKAQGCRKSSLQSMLGSKLASDVTQLKHKTQVKKNPSGISSRDKEVSPCSSDPKHRHRSQGTSKTEARRESGGQSDTGTYWLSCLCCSVLIGTVVSISLLQ